MTVMLLAKSRHKLLDKKANIISNEGNLVCILNQFVSVLFSVEKGIIIYFNNNRLLWRHVLKGTWTKTNTNESSVGVKR
jgi:hypothetical protein